MTAITTTFGKLRVTQRTATAPDVFSPFCGLTQFDINLSKQLNETVTPDCADPDAAAWIERDVDSRSVSISGTGLFARQWSKRVRDGFESNAPVRLRIFVDHPVSASVNDAATNVTQDVGFWTGDFHVQALNITPARGGRVQAEVSFESTGPVTWTQAINGTPQT
jgi:predicted secreted protein